MIYQPTSAAWIAAVEAKQREPRWWVEAVTLTGVSLGPVDVEQVTLSMDGEQSEQWDATFTITDPALIPASTSSILDGRSGVWLRVWWGLPTADGWMDVPCGTYVVEDPGWRDSGLVKITAPGLDPLNLVDRGGYGSHVIPVGGLTVDAALRRLFETVAPGLPYSLEPSTVTLPAGFELWSRSVREDWTEIAAMAGQVVRTNRMGVITSRRPPEPTTPRADWQEGPDCPVSDMGVHLKTSTIPRRVVVVSNNPDVTPPVVGEWVNPDADADMITREIRIESSTVTSVEAANNLARLTGERWARPQQTVEVVVPPRPDLAYRDLVTLGRVQSNVAGGYQVGSWDLTLSKTPGLMTVRMMTRQS